MENQQLTSLETITLGGGCFWCVEAVFVEVVGMLSVESGYAHGKPSFVGAPKYEQICDGDTGFAEVVQLHFDPAVISLSQVLAIFLAVHNPTTLNRQGNDVGTQYRSGIYWHDDRQADIVRAAVAEAGRVYADPVVTEVMALRDFWPAEAYHRRYFRHHPGAGYCSFVVAPKVGKFRDHFGDLRRDVPLD